MGAPASVMTAAGQPTGAPPGSPTEVFGRLAADVQRPWVAMRTNSQLLTYLAQRGHDPEIVSVSAMSELQPSTHSSSPLPVSAAGSQRRRHRNHRELFDVCLRGEERPSPASPGPRESS